ncbi:leucyl/phenylalanyl-tRNA--protein transferase [Actinocrispum wychmicini]|uniref:Leucyl/phenylalanyl-tRNA--protein transferase n=1 Tax=Actinocrispum wychmicini TaxID=1213861 RepID=A0A4R2IS57_9PSEU|nr:leucyl/phenylalanyl-tRNA--protein transferase [Actinocrispum wychmicini]TCO48094.1 leucyl/phenylalanyl-tRNA--protein transferase [Actinocrispum wychmicini]
MTDQARLLAHRMIGAYASGWFPMEDDTADTAEQMAWHTVELRAVIQPTDQGIARTRRSLKAHRWTFDVRADTDFDDVLTSCAAPRGNGQWLGPRLCDAYRALREMGFGRCFTVYDSADDVVGGTLVVTIGGAAFAESTFHRAPDAGNAAVLGMIELLYAEGCRLIDLQYLSGDHFRRFGAVEIPRGVYLDLLQLAMEPPDPRAVYIPRWLRASTVV